MIIELHNRYYQTPVKWNDLSRKQLLQIIDIIYSDIGEVEGRVKIMKVLTGISWLRLWWGGMFDIDDKLHLTDFLLQENTLTKNLIPKYKKLYGPADDFSNLIVSEFIFAEQFHGLYKETKDVENLDRMIACLYRPCKFLYNKKLNKDGDVRRDFNDHVIDYFAKKISRWPMNVKLGILTWYEGCRQKLVEDNPAVFGGSSSGETALYGLFSIMRGVAEKGIHGSLPQVEKMFVKVFLLELNEQVAEAERIERAHKK